MMSDTLVICLLLILVVIVVVSHFWSNFISTVSFHLFLFSILQCLFFTLGSCGFYPSSKAFLFSLYNAQGYNPVKLTQYQNQHRAIDSCRSYGPTFGSGRDIRIANGALNNLHSYTRCGYTYSVPSGYSFGDCGFFTGGRYFTPTDIEVFFETGN